MPEIRFENYEITIGAPPDFQSEIARVVAKTARQCAGFFGDNWFPCSDPSR
jgi:hypothetical protein